MLFVSVAVSDALIVAIGGCKPLMLLAFGGVWGKEEMFIVSSE